MRLALVDNLTLDAVQKLMGQVVAYYYDDPEDMIKEDVIAFDNLLNAILFSDQVIYIEGFMPDHNIAYSRGPYFPFFKQYRIGVVAYRTIVKDINDEFVLKYDPEGSLKDTPAFYSFEFMKQHVQLPVMHRLEYGALIYHTISANLGSDLVLFPSRATFQRKLMEDLVSEQQRHKPMRLNGESTISPKDSNIPVTHAYRVPMFIAWLAENHKDASLFIEIAQTMRDNPEFREIRKNLDRLRSYYDASGEISNAKTDKLEKILRAQFRHLCEKYKVTTKDGNVERNLTLVNNVRYINQNFIPVPGLTYPPPKEKASEEKKQKTKEEKEARIKELFGETGEEYFDVPVFFDSQLEYEVYSVLPRREHYVYLSDLDYDKAQLDKLGIIYDYITEGLIIGKTEKAKLYKEAHLLRMIKYYEEEAGQLFNLHYKEKVVDPKYLLNRKGLELSNKTMRFIKKTKIDESKRFEKEQNKKIDLEKK